MLMRHPLLQTLQGKARHSVRAFTLVEVAIALAIIGFALVAIIGILPAGLNVQRENREETIINQDVSIWMDAIRSGAEGMDYLTNYVEGIEIIPSEYDQDGNFLTTLDRSWYTPIASYPAGYPLENGAQIVGLLSTPKYEGNGNGGYYSYEVVAYVRAISGAAIDKVPQDNDLVRDSAFSYRLTSEVVPVYASSDTITNFADFQRVTQDGTLPGPFEPEKVRSLAQNAHELRLAFQWPLRPPLDNSFNPPLPTRVGRGRLTFRTLVGGSITNDFASYFFIQPGRFEKPE